MKIFLIEFLKVDWDQYNGFVIAAKNEGEVIDHLKKFKGKSDSINWESGYEIEEIKPKDYKETTIILEDYKAG